MDNGGLRALMAVSLGAAVLAGCSGEKLGASDGGTGGVVGTGGITGTGGGTGGSAVDGGATSVLAFAGSWDGYAEAYTFEPDGSDRVRLTITTNGQGSLEVGNAALLPPPTDPNVGYPPGGSDAGLGFLLPPDTSQLTEGFLYPLYATQAQGDRIQLGANPEDLYAAWCALQTPYVSYETAFSHDAGYTSVVPGIVDGGTVEASYRCLPNEGSMSGPNGCALLGPDGGSTPVNCGKLSLCGFGAVCTCSASGCVSQQVPPGTLVSNYPVELDAMLDSTGRTLTGTLNLDGNRVTVVLQKQ